MRHFKLLLIATRVVFALVLVTGVVGVMMIQRSPGSHREEERRAQLLGTGAATLPCVTTAPFWLFAAAKVGRERRAARDAGRTAAKPAAVVPPRRR